MVFLNALPGAVSEGLIWGLMAIGVYISYKILDIADLTVDGSICTGACVCAVLLSLGVPVWLSMLIAFAAGALAGVVTGLLHTALGIPSILAGILTQLIPAGKKPASPKLTSGVFAYPRVWYPAAAGAGVLTFHFPSPFRIPGKAPGLVGRLPFRTQCTRLPGDLAGYRAVPKGQGVPAGKSVGLKDSFYLQCT